MGLDEFTAKTLGLTSMSNMDDNQSQVKQDEPMIVCVCAAVPEDVFLDSLDEHGGDWRLAAMHSGAGQCCGTCRPFLAQVAAEHEARDVERVAEPTSGEIDLLKIKA